MKVGIRADGGPERGYGHLVRTGALTTELLRQGNTVEYLTTTPKEVDKICSNKIHIHSISEKNEKKDILRYLKNTDIESIVTDSYGIDQEYQRDLSQTGSTLAVIQGDARYDIHCDILINGHIFAEEVEYNWSGQEPEWCLGPKYLLLREEFTKKFKQSTKFRCNAKRAIVLMGGSDVNNRTPEVMNAFDGRNITVDVIIGPGYDNSGDIKKAAEKVDCCWKLHQNPSNLANLMREADFAVTALGTTTYELIATDTPVIGLLEAENQLPVAQALSKQELGVVVWDNHELCSAVDKMISDPELRKDLYRKYNSLVDGKGAVRITNQLMKSQI